MEKHILIAGADSYIGSSVESFLEQFEGEYSVKTLDMRGPWRTYSLSTYDTVLYVAGIVHKKEKKENCEIYYEVNRDLTFETAQKAKKEGVGQFIYLSSMSVYGMITGHISENTVPRPTNHYGKSKLQAEQKLFTLSDENFKVAVLRPPIVYGKGCKGNYQTLSKYAKKLPFFPDLKNRRSMIYIDNLSICIKSLLDEKKSGIFCPQNREYVCTSEMVEKIAALNGHKLYLTKLFNPFIKAAPIQLFDKVFGDLVYEDFEDYPQFYSFQESLIRTEGSPWKEEHNGRITD